MIEVKRYNNKERVYKSGKVVPASYNCYYYFSYNGRKLELAWYDSKDDILLLNSSYIHKDFSMKEYDRALLGKFKEAYEYLFSMLGVDKNTKMSEYFNV